MNLLLRGGNRYTPEGFQKADLVIAGGRIAGVIPEVSIPPATKVIPCDNFFIMPGFVDVHVHLREPGCPYKETIATGTAAAARGGYTSLCSMPNVDPPPDGAKGLTVQQDRIQRDARIPVFPYGNITRQPFSGSGEEELADFERLWQGVCAFSNDGRGVQGEFAMKKAMRWVAERNRSLPLSQRRIITAHCEDERWPTDDPRSEWKQVERDLSLAKETGCPYHICHVSTRETVHLVRQAKQDGVDVTCETAPHYLLLSEEDVPSEDGGERGGRFKMNPPIRTKVDRDALVEGLVDGIIDMIATDHAPHSREEKARGFSGSLFGIVGLETAFPVLYTHLVQKKILTLEALVEKMSLAPRRRFFPGEEEKHWADLVIMDLEAEYQIDPEQFQSKGRSTPFSGWSVQGETVMTLSRGKIVYRREGKQR